MSIETMTASTSATATHGSFTIVREFDAKPERVFAAFSTPEAKARWFTAPALWTQTERSLDFRVGGEEILAGRWEDGKVTHYRARFEEIVPNRRIVSVYHMHINDWHISISLATTEVEPSARGTKMTFTEHATFINGFQDANAEGRRTGTAYLFDNLEASLRE